MPIIRQAAVPAPRNAGRGLPIRRTVHRVRPSGPPPDRAGGGGEEDDPRLRDLTTRAHELIDALRRGLPVAQLSATLAGYVRAAREIGVRGERLHDALELLVHEHARAARGGPAAATLLHDLLRLADPEFRDGGCPHGREPAPVPHWCRLYRRTS
jgi:hypothetical protein